MSYEANISPIVVEQTFDAAIAAVWQAITGRNETDVDSRGARDLSTGQSRFQPRKRSYGVDVFCAGKPEGLSGPKRQMTMHDPDDFPFDELPGRFPCPKCATMTELKWVPVPDPIEQARAEGRCPSCGFDLVLCCEKVDDDEPEATIH